MNLQQIIEIRVRENKTETHSANMKNKLVVAERLVKDLKNNIYKYMTAVSKNMYLDKLPEY